MAAPNRLQQLADFGAKFGSEINADPEASKTFLEALKQEKKPPVQKLEDLPLADRGPAPSRGVDSGTPEHPIPPEERPGYKPQKQAGEPWEGWDQSAYEKAKQQVAEMEADGLTDRAAKGRSFLQKWEAKNGGSPGDTSFLDWAPGTDKKVGSFVPIPNADPVLGEPSWATAARQAQQAKELEQQGIRVPVPDPGLDSASKLNDPRYYRPSEYSNRESQGYSLLDMLPLGFGGKVEAWHEPSIEEFRTVKRAEIGDDVDRMNEDSLEYKKYSDEEWVRAYDTAKAQERPIFRHAVKTGALNAEGWGKIASPIKVAKAMMNPETRNSAIGAMAEEYKDQVTGGFSALDDAFGGPMKGLIGAVGKPEVAKEMRRAQEQTTVGPAVGAISGILSPETPAALVSRGTYNVAKRALPGAVGRTIAAAGAGAAGTAAQEGLSNEMRDLSGDTGPRTDIGNAAIVGGILSGPLHLAGEAINSRVSKRAVSQAPGAEELRQARAAGVEPRLLGPSRVPPDVEALRVEAAQRNVPPAVLQTEKMVGGGVQRAAIRAELANANTEAQHDLSNYFDSPEGQKQVSIKPVLDKARSLMDDITHGVNTPREGVERRDVIALQDFMDRLQEGGPTRDARGVADAIERMRRNFNMTPGSETNLTPEGEKIAKELTQEFLNIRDQFLPNEHAPPSLKYAIPTDEKNERVVSGLSALSHKRSEEIAAHAATKENAGLPKGELHAKPYQKGSVEGVQKLEANLDNRQLGNVRRVWAQYKSGGVDAIPRDTAIDAISKYDPKLQKDLKTLAANAAAENLDRFLRGGQTAILTGTPANPGGWYRLRPANLAVRSDPLQRKLAAESELPISENIVRLLKALRGQKTGAVAGPLAGPLSLRGGTAGARAEMALTSEDLGNLKALLGLYRQNGERNDR